jgi:hypothetical protein
MQQEQQNRKSKASLFCPTWTCSIDGQETFFQLHCFARVFGCGWAISDNGLPIFWVQTEAADGGLKIHYQHQRMLVVVKLPPDTAVLYHCLLSVRMRILIALAMFSLVHFSFLFKFCNVALGCSAACWQKQSS